MTTVQASCFSKNMISSLLRSLRLTAVVPASSTAWTWKTDFAVSRPIMAMLIAGGSFSADPHEAGEEDLRALLQRPADGPRQQAADPLLQNPIGRQADSVADTLTFQPPSEVIWAPWNWSLIRRSKATRSGLFVSPVASAILGSLRYLYHAEIYT